MSLTHWVTLVVASLVIWGLAVTLGRRLLDSMFPAISRLLDTFDDRLASAEERDVRANYLRIQNASSTELHAEVIRAFQLSEPRTAPRSDDLTGLLLLLPEIVQRFFQEHDRLAVSEGDVLLDIEHVRSVIFSGETFVGIGRLDEDEQEALYAVRRDDTEGRVVALGLDDNGSVVSVEPEAKSVEHFIALHVAVHPVTTSHT